MNDKIKTLIQRINWLFQCARKSGNLDYASLKFMTQDISNTIKTKIPKLVLYSSLITLKGKY